MKNLPLVPIKTLKTRLFLAAAAGDSSAHLLDKGQSEMRLFFLVLLLLRHVAMQYADLAENVLQSASKTFCLKRTKKNADAATCKTFC